MAFYAPLAGVIFAASMLFATLMRRHVVSMVFSLATAVMLQTAAGMNRTMQHIAWYVREEQVEPAQVAGYILVCLIVTVLLGWLMVLSVKGNWRSRLEAAIAPARAGAAALIIGRRRERGVRLGIGVAFDLAGVDGEIVGRIFGPAAAVVAGGGRVAQEFGMRA